MNQLFLSTLDNNNFRKAGLSEYLDLKSVSKTVYLSGRSSVSTNKQLDNDVL